MVVPTEAELSGSVGREYELASILLERILAERRAHWQAQEKRRGKYGAHPDGTSGALAGAGEASGQVWSASWQNVGRTGRCRRSIGASMERILAERRAHWQAQEKRRGKYKEPSIPASERTEGIKRNNTRYRNNILF